MPSMLLTVNDDIDAVFIFRLLKEPEPPCTLLTVKQDNTAQPPYRVLTFAEEIDATPFTSVLTSKLDTFKLGISRLAKLMPSMLLTLSDDIDAVFIFRLLKEPEPPCRLLTVKQDNTAQPPYRVLTFADEIDARPFTRVLTSKLDTFKLGISRLAKLIPSMLLTLSDDIDAVFIFRLLKEPDPPCTVLTCKLDTIRLGK